MKCFNPETLAIESHHLLLGHLQIVGNKEPSFVPEFGDKQKDGSHPRQFNQSLGHPKFFLLPKANRFVVARPLCQVLHHGFATVHLEDPILSNGSQINPRSLLNGK